MAKLRLIHQIILSCLCTGNLASASRWKDHTLITAERALKQSVGGNKNTKIKADVLEVHPQFAPCEEEFFSNESLFVDEYVVYVTTQAVSELLMQGESGKFNAQPLKRQMLDPDNFYVYNYWEKLPDSEPIPNPAFKIYIKYACQYAASTYDAETIAFCNNSSVTNAPPAGLNIPFSSIDTSTKARIIKRICKRFVGNWDALVANVETYYRRKNLIFSNSGETRK